MNFSRYRFIIPIAVLASSLLILALRGPFYEAFVDVSVSPPENIRRTDFSWITVNEWFLTQSHLIESHAVLKNITHETNEEKLRKIVSAKRISGADIIRISVKSNEQVDKSIKICEEIASLYVKIINKEEGVPVKEEIREEISQRKNEVLTVTINTLTKQQNRLKGELLLVNQKLQDYEIELSKLQVEAKILGDSQIKIIQLDNQIAGLNQKLAQLRTIYTDNWPAVVELKQKVEPLEKERLKLFESLPPAQEIEDRKNELTAQIRNAKTNIENIKAEINRTDNRLNSALASLSLAQGVPEQKINPPQKISPEETGFAFIINPATINFFPDLGTQFIYSGLIAALSWLALRMIFR